jgi:hypothetical protein
VLAVSRCPVGQVVTAAVPEHMRPDAAQFRVLASETDNVIDSLADHRLAALGYEEPCRLPVRVAR